MPKIKTVKAAAKRFKVTASGKIKRGKAFKSHILSSKTTERKRKLRMSGYVSACETSRIKRMLANSL